MRRVAVLVCLLPVVLTACGGSFLGDETELASKVAVENLDKNQSELRSLTEAHLNRFDIDLHKGSYLSDIPACRLLTNHALMELSQAIQHGPHLTSAPRLRDCPLWFAILGQHFRLRKRSPIHVTYVEPVERFLVVHTRHVYALFGEGVIMTNSLDPKLYSLFIPRRR